MDTTSIFPDEILFRVQDGIAEDKYMYELNVGE